MICPPASQGGVSSCVATSAAMFADATPSIQIVARRRVCLILDDLSVQESLFSGMPSLLEGQHHAMFLPAGSNLKLPFRPLPSKLLRALASHVSVLTSQGAQHARHASNLECNCPRPVSSNKTVESIVAAARLRLDRNWLELGQPRSIALLTWLRSGFLVRVKAAARGAPIQPDPRSGMGLRRPDPQSPVETRQIPEICRSAV